MIGIKVPVEGQITKWNVKLGDLVKKDQPLLEMTVDGGFYEAEVALPSPASGKIIAIKANIGDDVEIESLVGTINEEIDVENAINREKILDYKKAIEIYGELNLPKEVERVRKVIEEKKVKQNTGKEKKITNIEIKDSVLNRSNVGGSPSKIQELEKLAEMKEKGLIDDDEFKQMKNEILEK